MDTDILIINGSPRKNKNCFLICDYIKQRMYLENITCEVFDIYDMNIEYCTFCGYCEKVKGCKFKDDMSKMYDKFNKAKGVIVVSPVCFDSVSSKLKTLVDRTQAIYTSKYILNDSIIDRSKKRLGMYIAVGGSKSYNTQFLGGQIVMDFFFKSINNKLKYSLYLNNTDEIGYKENESFKALLKESIDNYINDFKKDFY